MRQIKAYLLSYYRGPNGDEATQEEIDGYVSRATQIGVAIQSAFPDAIDLFIPHLNQDITAGLYDRGYVDSDNILEVCCDIIANRELAIILKPMVGSVGMEMELNAFANAGGEHVLEIDEWNDYTRERIGRKLAEINEM